MRASTRKILRDYSVAIIAAVAIALFIRIFIVEAYRIPTPAMRPTLEPGDTIFVTKSPFGFDRNRIRRGDVVVFGSPNEPGRDYVKRVLGLPGDTVEVLKGKVTLNGHSLELPSDKRNPLCGLERVEERDFEVCWEPPLTDDFAAEKVPAGAVFVLGDLRSKSPSDAKKRHSWGMIPTEAIKGRAGWIWLSIEPRPQSTAWARFPGFRFERMFRRIQ